MFGDPPWNTKTTAGPRAERKTCGGMVREFANLRDGLQGEGLGVVFKNGSAEHVNVNTIDTTVALRDLNSFLRLSHPVRERGLLDLAKISEALLEESGGVGAGVMRSARDMEAALSCCRKVEIA
eukprot:2838285-Pyramimonas_sp.AAC.1